MQRAVRFELALHEPFQNLNINNADLSKRPEVDISVPGLQKETDDEAGNGNKCALFVQPCFM